MQSERESGELDDIAAVPEIVRRERLNHGQGKCMEGLADA